MNFLNSKYVNFRSFLPAFTETQQKTAKTYGLWMYGLIVGMSTVYGVKKGIQQWFEWKRIRRYKSLHNQNIDTMIDIACDGGTLAYYAMLNGVISAFIASTAPISVPLLHFFRLDRNNLRHSYSTESFESDDDSCTDNNHINNILTSEENKNIPEKVEESST